jgi:hypothetical protein
MKADHLKVAGEIGADAVLKKPFAPENLGCGGAAGARLAPAPTARRPAEAPGT